MNATEVTAGLADALADAWMAPDLRSARVLGRELAEPEPRDLEKKIGLALYEAVHLRRLDGIAARARLVRDQAFEAVLREAVPHRELLVPTTVLRRDHECVLVALSGVRVWVPSERLTRPFQQIEAGPAEITMRPDRAALSPGFLLVHGSCAAGVAGPVLRVYIHIRSSSQAAAVWHAVLGCLEQERVAYRAKVASARWFYPRSDAMAIYLPKDAWHATTLITRAVGGFGLAGPESLLCRKVADGVAVAWDPVDARLGRSGLSFGEHRASVIASALLESARTGEDRSAALRRSWQDAQVDPDRVWRNTDSPEFDLT